MPDREKRPSWTKYTGKRVACDECVAYLHENRVTTPLPRSARMLRTVGDQRLRLCTDHAQLRRTADDRAEQMRNLA